MVPEMLAAATAFSPFCKLLVRYFIRNRNFFVSSATLVPARCPPSEPALYQYK